MKESGILFIIALVSFLVLIGVVWAFQGSDFFLYKVFAPKYEEAKREVFEQSKEYQHGTIGELDKMYLEYIKSNDPDVRAALENRALRMTAEFDKSKLPEDLQEWIYSIRSDRQ